MYPPSLLNEEFSASEKAEQDKPINPRNRAQAHGGLLKYARSGEQGDITPLAMKIYSRHFYAGNFSGTLADIMT